MIRFFLLILLAWTVPTSLMAFLPTTKMPPPCGAHNHRSTNTNNNKSLVLGSRRMGCSVELTDQETGCTVVLLGCFHGSQSSAVDVRDALLMASSSTTSTTDVVALELCAQRFADLRRDYEKATNSNNIIRSNDEDNSNEESVNQPITASSASSVVPWIARYVSMIGKTATERGWATAMAAALLGGVSGLQTAVSSLEPGLEFTTALSIATEHEMDVVLADQAVDTTLSRLGNLPSVSLEMWKEFLKTGSWDETFGKEASALKMALLGNNVEGSNSSSSSSSVCHHQVTLPAFLTRSDAAVKDLVRLTVPPLLILQALNLAISESVGMLLNHPAFAASNAILLSSSSSTSAAAAADSGDPLTGLALFIVNALFLSLGFVSVALPATRIILRERDDQLVTGIQAACRLARGRTEHHPRVVAVLGLLHVNGVAQRMLANNHALLYNNEQK